jgi:hypothetical protein
VKSGTICIIVSDGAGEECEKVIAILVEISNHPLKNVENYIAELPELICL